MLETVKEVLVGLLEYTMVGLTMAIGILLMALPFVAGLFIYNWLVS